LPFFLTARAMPPTPREPIGRHGRKRFTLDAHLVAAVMCLGDSWLAGFNAASLGTGSPLQDAIAMMHANVAEIGMVEHRGASFGCGDGIILFPESHTGQSAHGGRHMADATTPPVVGMQVETLGTLLRRESPGMQALSRGTTPFRATLLSHPLACGLNAAVSGASVTGVHSVSFLAQAGMLIGLVERGRYKHLASSWKVLTVQAGVAELMWGTHDVESFTQQMRFLLGYLRQHLPFTYVNLLALPENAEDLRALASEREAPSGCGERISFYALHLRISGASPRTEHANQTAAAFNAALRSLAVEADDDERFIVRYQPFLTAFPFRASVLDSLSCLHPRAAMQQAMSHALLQNMVSEPADKWQALDTLLDFPTSDEVLDRIFKHAATGHRGGNRTIVLR